jgi:group I intron endonuclease
MNSKEAGIYSITSKINGKRYIGSAIRICTRWSNHKSMLKINKHHSPQLQNHYNKYGLEDLIFSVVEIIEKADLTLQEFKELLLEREQFYLNNWNECQFNCLKTAGSLLGRKTKNSKYYIYKKEHKTYQTYYSINGVRKYFNSYELEEDAKLEIEYIKSLNEEQLIEYTKTYKNRSKTKIPKNYMFDAKSNKWRVSMTINTKNYYFGSFYTEQEAINQVDYINTLNIEDKLKYGDSKSYPKIHKRKSNSKYYTFNKARNKWIVQIKTNKITKIFDCFETEQEAINKVKELKIELGIK